MRFEYKTTQASGTRNAIGNFLFMQCLAQFSQGEFKMLFYRPDTQTESSGDFLIGQIIVTA